MAKTQKLSYPDSKRIINEAVKKIRAISSLVEQAASENESEAKKAQKELRKILDIKF